MKKFKLEKHYVLLGWNLKGPQIVDILMNQEGLLNKHIVLIADIEKKPIESPFLHFIKTTYPVTKKKLIGGSIESCLKVIVLADYEMKGTSDAITAANCILIKSLNNKCKIYAELLNPRNKELLYQAGAFEVIGIGELGGKLIAGSCIEKKEILDILEKLR